MKKHPHSPSVGKAATTGLVWLLLQSLTGRGLSLVSQLILAKLLIPEDFGIIGLATTITTIFGVVTNVGVDQVLQQRRSKIRYWATQAFWISLSCAILTAIAMAVYAPIGARIYNNQNIIPIVWIMALSIPLSTLSLVPQVKLQSQLRFKFLATANSGQSFLMNVSTIALAWCGMGALSFVLPTPFLAIIKAIIFWKLAPVRLMNLRRVKGWASMTKRGATVLGGNISKALMDQGDYIVLGIIASTSVVGYYFFAFKLAVQPLRLLGNSFTNVLFPALTTLSAEPEKQRDVAFKVNNILSMLVIPIYMVQAAVAEPLITLLFGDRWSNSILYIQILSLGLCFDAPAWATGAFLNARGQFKKKSIYHAICTVLFYIFVGIGALAAQGVGVACAVAFYYVVHPVFYSLYVFVREGISVRRVLSGYFTPWVLGVASVGPAYLFASTGHLTHNLIAQTLAISLWSAVVYLILVRVFLPDLSKEVVLRIRAVLNKSKLS